MQKPPDSTHFWINPLSNLKVQCRTPTTLLPFWRSHPIMAKTCDVGMVFSRKRPSDDASIDSAPVTQYPAKVTRIKTKSNENILFLEYGVQRYPKYIWCLPTTLSWIHHLGFTSIPHTTVIFHNWFMPVVVALTLAKQSECIGLFWNQSRFQKIYSANQFKNNTFYQ